MKPSLTILFIGLILLTTAGCQKQAGQTTITVEDAWIRAVNTAGTMEHTMEMQTSTPEAAGDLTTAAFITITNFSKEADHLLRIETDLAQTVEIHRSEIQNDVMTMRPVDSIEIPAGESVELKPGGYHIMLIGLQQEIKPGEMYPLTLVLEKAGLVLVEAEGRAP